MRQTSFIYVNELTKEDFYGEKKVGYTVTQNILSIDWERCILRKARPLRLFYFFEKEGWPEEPLQYVYKK